MASGLNGCRGDLGRSLAMCIWIFADPVVFILPMPALEVAHRFLGTLIKLGDLLEFFLFYVKARLNRT